jgi:hypothetical protein
MATVIGRETDELHKFSTSCKNDSGQMSLPILVPPPTHACLDNFDSSDKAVADIGILYFSAWLFNALNETSWVLFPTQYLISKLQTFKLYVSKYKTLFSKR